MSFLGWLVRKPQVKPSAGAEPPRRSPAPQPPHRGGPLHVMSTSNSSARVALASPDNASRYKAERAGRREQLFGVIRESMVRSGVLSACYTFKVLALDRRGRQFVVMIDLAGELGTDAGRQAGIEAMIAQVAKARYDTVVTAVYWRLSEQVTVAAAAPVAADRAPPTRPRRLTGYEDTEKPDPDAGTPGLSATQYGDL